MGYVYIYIYTIIYIDIYVYIYMYIHHIYIYIVDNQYDMIFGNGVPNKALDCHQLCSQFEKNAI